MEGAEGEPLRARGSSLTARAAGKPAGSEADYLRSVSALTRGELSARMAATAIRWACCVDPSHA